jgi:hypothetical protein
MSPFGVIDFVDNHCLSAAAPVHAAGVVGGPPAYLDAHGIRYVPAASLEGGMDSADAGPQLVPMSRSAAADPAPVSQGELNSRVEDRVRRFMSGRGDLRELRDDISSSSLRGDVDYDDRRRRLDDVRDRVRSARDDREEGAAADLRALRRQMEEDAAGMRSRMSGARGGKSRDDLRRGGAIDF